MGAARLNLCMLQLACHLRSHVLKMCDAGCLGSDAAHCTGLFSGGCHICEESHIVFSTHVASYCFCLQANRIVACKAFVSFSMVVS